MKDIVKAVIVLAVLSVVGAFVWSSTAEADGWFEEPPYTYIGLYKGDGPYCHGSEYVGHLGVGQEIYQNDRHVLEAQYIHQSCAFEGNDKNTFDSIGVTYKFYLGD